MNNKTDALKTDVNLSFLYNNKKAEGQNYKSMCLSVVNNEISQWNRVNFCRYCIIIFFGPLPWVS